MEEGKKCKACNGSREVGFYSGVKGSCSYNMVSCFVCGGPFGAALTEIEITSEVVNFIRDLIKIEEVDERLEKMFDVVDEWIGVEDFDSIEETLAEVNVRGGWSPTTLVGFLTITAPVKKYLKNRAKFFKEVKNYFEELEIDLDNLTGLE